jgi:hypothetical protein
LSGGHGGGGPRPTNDSPPLRCHRVAPSFSHVSLHARSCLLLPKDQIHDPAAAHVRPGTAAVGQNVGSKAVFFAPIVCLPPRSHVAWPLLLSQQQIDHSATAHVGSWSATVRQDRRVRAAGFFERVGEEGEAGVVSGTQPLACELAVGELLGCLDSALAGSVGIPIPDAARARR